MQKGIHSLELSLLLACRIAELCAPNTLLSVVVEDSFRLLFQPELRFSVSLAQSYSLLENESVSRSVVPDSL